MTRNILIFILAALVGYFGFKFFIKEDKFLSVLVFSKTEGFRHASIKAGKEMMLKMGKEHGFRVDTTEDASFFKERTLSEYNVVVFMNTTGDVLNDAQQLEFNRFIQAGGGFVGIHAAADTEYDWPWYGDLVGAYFKSHPQIQEASSDKIEKNHTCVAHLPERWTRTDEWYNFKDIRTHINVLLNLDESSYKGGENGDHHPITWYHEFDGGRAFYTGMGHTDETYEDENYVEMIWRAVQWTANEMKPVDFNRSTVAPEENRFQKVVLADYLYEPMELEMLPDGRIIFIERRGSVKIFDLEKDTLQTVNTFKVYDKLEDGLLGMALDPNFEENHWIYFYYSPPNVTFNQLSRITFTGDSLNMSSEIKVLEVATQRDTCCHSGGSIEFGPGGNLFLSTGDNTNPFESNGYGPIDEIEGRKYFDAQRTSGNTNDLRGKVLRIHPEPDGTYSIPDGNLFPKDGSVGRPEIYVMGCRNPWRIHVDSHTGHLYWGDVGPDAGEDSLNVGPKGHDEVNMAREAGFFGWPYFVGDNKAYFDRDFKTGEVPTKEFDPKSPFNDSPNNTGAKNLPPAQPAYIWYPYGESEEFPLTLKGGRNAMAGPVFYHSDYKENDGKYPQYYDKKLFTYDWIRGWVMAITQKENGDFERMERFLPSIKWSNPTDIIFSPNGDMFVLEYGNSWYSQNEDARLVHLKYISGNRPPLVKIEANKSVGKTPLTVQFTGDKSKDFDGDELSFKWYFEDDRVGSTEINPTHTFEKPGYFKVRLVADDGNGGSTEEIFEITAGNEAPKIEFELAGNQSFFFDNEGVNYKVKVTDAEDGTLEKGISPEKVAMSIDYLENGFDVTQVELGHKQAENTSQFAVGKDLIEKSDCRACHADNKKVAGPSYEEVAEKYQNQPGIIPTLANRIIKGSNGIWGDQLMSAHPQLTQSEAELMVKYVLSLSEEATMSGLPVSGNYAFDKHQSGTDKGVYIFNASYTDKGAPGTRILSVREMTVLRSNMISATDYDDTHETERMDVTPEMVSFLDEKISLMSGRANGWLKFEQLDLTGISEIETIASAVSLYFQGGILEFRLDSEDGELIGSEEIETVLMPTAIPEPIKISIKPTEGKRDVFVVFKTKKEGGDKPVCAVVYFKFLKGLTQ